MEECPLCKKTGDTVIYLGFPMYLCSDDQCNAVWGFWCWVVEIYFNGYFHVYYGSYCDALWEWLFE